MANTAHMAHGAHVTHGSHDTLQAKVEQIVDVFEKPCGYAQDIAHSISFSRMPGERQARAMQK